MNFHNYKQKIYVYAPLTKLVFDDLVKTSFIQEFEKIYDVEWIFSEIENVKSLNLQKYKILKNNKLQNNLFNLMYYFETKNFNIKHNIKWIFPLFKFSFLINVFIKIINFFNLDNVLIYLLYRIRIFIFNNDIFFLKNTKLIIFGSAKDPYFLNLIYKAKKAKVTTIHIPINWDNASTKNYYLKPDLILTWGNQTAEISSQLHNIKSMPIGSLRLSKLNKNIQNNNSILKKKYFLDKNKKYFIFAGAGLPYDEISILELLNSECDDNTFIIYKPHPYQQLRKYENKFKLKELFKIIQFNDYLKYEKNHFNCSIELMSICDGLITPYSTMILEALFFNKSVIAVSIADKIHSNLKWNYCTELPHLKIFAENDIILKSDTISSLKKNFDIIKSKEKNVDVFNSELFNKIVYRNDLNYIDKLKKFIDNNQL
ncbi:MAG: hypothetical protein CMI96_04110 [Pelagibacteraceae bacterium]|nr:hypothetical protein [Pelagibacteraceae bacterium]|tara:strand:+ start:21060 stop:22343 length:1284 start_codon:yes stop_codon:yes gene_type:complete